MKKNNVKTKKNSVTVSPEEALRFLEDIRNMANDVDEPTVAISLRIPANILRAIKLKAKADGQKYQSLMVAYLRNSVKQK